MRDDAPAGRDLADWVAPPAPSRESMTGRTCALRPLTVDMAEALHAANAQDTAGAMWAWLPYGPFDSLGAYRDWLRWAARGADPLFFAIETADGPAGVASYLRIAPASGSIEIGHIALSPRLQRTTAASEALMLLIRWAFAAGYRRVEWKCNAENAGSRAAALRLGFSFEGVFRHAGIVKGRNRDTAWYAMVDADWPGLSAAHARWLEPANFDAEGRQRARLSDLTRPHLVAQG